MNPQEHVPGFEILDYFYSGVQLSFYTYYISPIEIGVFWGKITYLKSHSKSLNYDLQINMK